MSRVWNYLYKKAAWAGVALAILLTACGGPDRSGETPEALVEAPSGPYSSDEYDVLLSKYVDEAGMVNYKGLNEERLRLDRYVASLGAIDPVAYRDWSEDEKLALWINAYNAITLKYILDHYPIEKGGLIAGFRYPANSIRQIPGVWDRLTTKVVDRELTLDAIEHQILRDAFDEPRIHVAIVCASIGCPPLRNEAFTAENIDEQLEDQAREFLSREGNFRIDREAGVVYLSSLFDWFGRDFAEVYEPSEGFSGHGATERAVLNFVSGRVADDDAAYLQDGSYRIQYLDYDWSLNEQS